MPSSNEAEFMDLIMTAAKSILGLVSLIIVLVGVTKAGTILMRGNYSQPAKNVSNEPSSDEMSRRRKDLTKLINRHKNLSDRWLSHLKDPNKFLDLPAMTDVSIPEVGEFIDALAVADETLIQKPPSTPNWLLTESPYWKAVSRAEAAYAKARKTAIHMRESQMTPDEREKLDLIRNLLDTARNNAASPNERRLAYDRASKMINELGFTMPEAMHEQIEHAVQGILEHKVEQ